MNQTQTRSPRKRWLSLLLAVVLMIGLLPISAFASNVGTQENDSGKTAGNQEFMRIFHLDCGRKYFTVKEIEGIIDQLAENHYTHIQLAFGNDGLRFLLNDMSVTVNGTKYDSEKVTTAIKNGNSSYNSDTSAMSGELSQGDMDAIIAYANGKGIQVIPMFNAPGHMYTVVKAKSELGMGNDYKNVETYGQGKSPNWAIKPTDGTAVAFAEALLQKYAAYFASKGSTMFNVGADESGLNSDNYLAYAKMVNAMNKIVKSEGMKTLAYNDGIYHTSYSSALKGKGENGADFTFDTDIIICYWTDGENLATVETLLGKGFEVLNNTNNWYYVLGDFLFKIWAGGQWGYETALNGIKNTPVTRMKDGKDYANSKRLLGSILCVWCDGPSVGYDENGYSSSSHPGAGQTNRQSVYNLIAEMAKQNPDYFKDTTPVLAPVDGGTVSPVKQADGSYNVAVAANDTVQLRLANSTAENITWTSGNEAVATVSTNGLVTFTGTTGTVTITAQLQPVTRADEGASYTVTFNVTEKGAPIPVTVAVGRTVKETLQGDQTTISGDSNYSEYVTVQAEHKTTTDGNKLLEITSANDLVSGAQYLIANQRMGVEGNTNQLLTTEPSKWNGYSVLALSGAPATDSTARWTITKTNSGYTLMNGSDYLNIDNHTASAGSESYLTLACQDNNGTAGYPDKYWNISFSDGGTTYYLNALGGDPGAGGWAGNQYEDAATDIGSRWTIYRIVDEGATDTTTVSFTGKQVGGPVTVTVGNTTYSVTVVEKQNVEIPISIIDYRADGLLFDWTYNPGSSYADSYRYGLVHGKALYWGSASSGYSYERGTLNTNTGLYEASSTIEHIEGTTYQKTGSVFSHTDFYPNSTDNDWSRAGLVQERLGSNGMPVYTDAAVKYVASLLAKGYYNDVSDSKFSCNTLLKNTFLTEGASRSVLASTAPTDFSENFRNAKTYANITNAYDLAWYLLNTIYQADTNMTTVTGTDKAEHQVPIYGMAVDAYKSIVLTDDGSGTYSFEAGYSGTKKDVQYDWESGTIYNGTNEGDESGFYPLENLGYEQPGLLTNTSRNDGLNETTGRNRNGSFTLRGESQFVYNKDSNLYFTFTGDDDVYMYINGVLALDLGGAHGRNTKTVELNKLDAQKYGLVDGQVATFTFFYMERCSDASTFGIKTNMELVQRDIAVEKKAYDTSYANEYASGTAVINGTTVAYDLIVTNKSNSPMSQIKLTDTDSLGGNVTIGSGVDVSPVVTPGKPNDKGTVALGQGNGYVLFITDSNGTEVANTRKSLGSLQALSNEIAKLTLPAGQSLHVRFLTAKTEINESKILDYINTVEVSANVGGQALSDTASHELYSYNAKDTGRTYVVDFGLPLEITGIFDTGAQRNIGDVSLSPKNVQKYGTVTIAPNGFDTTLTYTRTADKTINEPETITLDVVYKIGNSNIKLEKTLTIIPASNVYYEDSLASFQPGKGVAENAKWSTVDNNGNAATEDGGSNVYQALEELGKHRNVYGHDDAYNKDNSSMLSMGTAHKVTVTSAMADPEKWTNDSAWPTASFTFTGTGFDVISLTNNKSGAIFVDVYAGSKAEGKAEKKYVVNNYYGYTYENGKWIVKENASDTLYQIPVMKITDLAYGEHTVVIKVAYSEYFDTANKSEYSFWLDAIRVYNPMGKDYDYTADNEGYPQYIKLRDELAKTAQTNKGVVFIDGAANASIADYANFGPNNEVYLANGQAISFKVPANEQIASIQIGAKAPDGKKSNIVVTGSETGTNPFNRELETATEMYYDITEQAKNGQLVTITNKSDGILSLTNLKITYRTSGQTVTLSELTAEEQANAVAMVQALFAAPVETFSPETFQADWGRAVRAGKRATLTVKTSADVESITVDGQPITSYTTRTERTGWGWWSPKVTYRVFTYTTTAPAQTTDYAVCAVNAEGTASEPITATLTVRPATWWNWWF